MSLFIPATSSGRVSATTKSAPRSRNACTGRRGAGTHAAEHLRDAAAGQVGVLLGARERELLLGDLVREHEPRVVVAGRGDRAERAERVEAGERRAGKPAAARVEPQRRRAGQDPDAVPRPDRVPVPHALGVVPHPVAVHQRGRRRARRSPSIRPSTCSGTPEIIRFGGVPSRAGQYARTRSWSAPIPPDVTITACARELERADLVAGARRAARGGRRAPARRRARRSTTPSVTVSSSTRCRNRSSPGPSATASRTRARTARPPRARCPT